jgi:hypothetical protein
MRHSRHTFVFAAVAVVLAVLAGGCGSSVSDVTSASVDAARSADGIVVVNVPAGAADDDVEVSVATIADADLPAELARAGIITIGYELSPDGAEFSEPLAITFTVDPVNLDLGLGDGEVPLGLVVTEDATGDLVSLGGEFSREDGMVVARAGIDHFSPAFLVLSKTEAVALVPDQLNMAVGDVVKVAIQAATAEKGRVPLTELNEFFSTNSDWHALEPFSIVQNFSVGCDAPSNGVVFGAFSVLVTANDDLEFLIPTLGLDIFGIVPQFALSGSARCGESAPTETPNPSATPIGTTPRVDSDETGSDLHLLDPAGDAACDGEDTLDPALDLRSADMVQDGDEIEITLMFEGDAEAYNNSTSDAFPVSVQFRLKEGGPYPEALFEDKTAMKVSGGLLQIVSYEFSGKELTIRVKGRSLAEVQGVRASTFLFGNGFCEDEVKSEGYDG